MHRRFFFVDPGVDRGVFHQNKHDKSGTYFSQDNPHKNVTTITAPYTVESDRINIDNYSCPMSEGMQESSVASPCDEQEDTSKEDVRSPAHEESESLPVGADLLYGGSNIAAACAATNAIARPQVDLTDEQQRIKRLQMNRANAQRNRDRKRIMIDMLRSEKNQLIESNTVLKAHNEELRKAIEHVKLRLRKFDKEEVQSGNAPGTKRKLDFGRLPVDIQSATQAQRAPNPFSYRTDVVNAMARDLLLQEQLLVNRLNHAPHTRNQQLCPLLLNPSDGQINDRQGAMDGIQSQMNLGMMQLNQPSMLLPRNFPLQPNLIGGFPYGGQRSLGLVGAPSLRLDSPFQVPARAALLSSITPRLDDSLASASASLGNAKDRRGTEGRNIKKGKLS